MAALINLNDWRKRRHSQDLDDWLKHQSGRCPECGYHIATQGHSTDCNER